ncbi:squalene/phytoene synthase family protein, partial [Atlantibacter hermannii]
MNKPLFNHAAQTMRNGSKSFDAAARLFDPETRRSVLMLYTWCRHCDDV